MSLFIDSDHVTTADLNSIDPEVSKIGSLRGIVIEGDGSVIRNAWSDAANRLLAMVQNYSGSIRYGSTSFVSASNFSGNTPKLRLDHLIVSSPYDNAASQMKAWLVQAALRDFYRTALYKSAADDRLSIKHDLAREEEAKRWSDLVSFGLPVVMNPLAAPGASHVIGAGTWTASAASGGSASPGSWRVVITWVDSSGYVSAASRGNAESGPSAEVAVTLAANEQIAVDISGLVPPGSVAAQTSVADGTFWTRTATHWNVYAAQGNDPLRLQNSSPIAIATTSHSFTPSASGSLISPGQYADANFTIQSTWMRG